MSRTGLVASFILAAVLAGCDRGEPERPTPPPPSPPGSEVDFGTGIEYRGGGEGARVLALLTDEAETPQR